MEKKFFTSTTLTKDHYYKFVQSLPAAVYTCDAEGRNECPMAIALREGRHVYGQEMVIERPDGIRLNVLPHPDPIKDASGNVVEGVNMLVDITDRKRTELALYESEERFRTMADEAPVMIWMADHLGNMVYFNARWSTFTGKSTEEGYGTKWTDFIHPEDKECAYKQWNAAIREKRACDITFRYRNVHQEYFILRATGNPYSKAAGEPEVYIGVLQDITIQEQSRSCLEKVVEERTLALKLANTQLEKSNSELEQFAYIASHDLQEPLRKIRTFAGLLEKYIDDREKTKVYLEKITESSERMMTLIRDLLEFSKLSKTQESYTGVDLNEVVQGITKDFELSIQEKKATIHHDPLPVIPAIPFQIHQLFYNLIGNSLKFSSQDVNPVINIRLRELSGDDVKKRPGLHPDTEYYKLEFEDNGIGFAQEYADHIFTIFHRLNGQHAFSGTGIGLALCKKIVLHHHGDIYATACENKGATFHVILPRKQGPGFND
jgi:two-component system CheB/CheR fusion protein